MENLVICNGSSTSSRLKRVRCSSVVLGMCNMAVIILSALVVISASPDCSGTVIFSFVLVMVSCILRIMSMIGTGIAQEATASAILNSPSTSDDAVIRHERRTRYKRWLWWTRFGLGIYVVQFLGATYLMFIVVKYITQNGKSGKCFSGSDPYGNGWDRSILVLLIIILWFLVTFQCVAGSDVLRWRSFYATHDNAWKAHYRELFDYGIRETLCCLGRGKYLSVLEEDEVYSVAKLLGDLVAYRASGTGHLELLAGLALLQRHRQAASSHDEFTEAPEEQIGEAAVFHPFAEAAYTGPLLDFGRNPILFPCAWLYRQGVLTPWTRKRRPVLEGDNWWRGHAAAFLKYVNQSPETLRRGRVSQAKCQAAYFVVVLHHLRSIVVSVRGTETPEDLITDGLCRESTLSVDDLDGLINSDHLDLNVKQRVISSFPHYGHSGIVEAARELFVQVDGQPGDCDAPGFLSSLVASGHECDGYNIRIVGHSLGGAIATLLGLRLYRRYPNLHVYSYGSLPCVDSIVAAACSDFVTSIVYGDEFSSRLSVNSITRLRAAAITALSQDSSADSAMICKLARRVLYINKYCMKKGEAVSAPFQSGTMTTEDGNHMYKRHCKHAIKGCNEQDHEFPSLEVTEITDSEDASILRANSNEVGFSNVPNSCSYACFETANDVLSCNDPVAEFMHAIPSSNQPSVGDPPEMFLPGLIIHIVRQQRSLLPSWKSWRVGEREHGYRAYGANREHFKDIIVSPYMFLDHLPWRCHYAMQKVLEVQKGQAQHREIV